jgi:hypothetical protein
MNKKLILIAFSMSFIFQSCAVVNIVDPSKKNNTQEQIGTEPSHTEVSCVEVNPNTGIYTIDASGCVSVAGDAYRGAYNAVLLAGNYGHGSETWNKEYEEWLNGDSEESPEKFNDIDGVAYHEAVNAAEDAAQICKD